MTLRVLSFYKEYQMFNFTLYNMNNEEMNYLWTIRPNIAKEGIHVLVEFKPIQSQTFLEVQHTNVSIEENHPNIPHHVTRITQMVFDEPSMLYPSIEEDDDDNDDANEDYRINNALYDYTQSRAFLDMGSGEQIDDLIKSGTIRLLDCNDAMIDIQLGIRFVDKIQTISTVQKWSTRTG
ncbi:hypothetical protein M9H77_22906 [Catharanthus roseus]|uniref:Uncharacterized protein n=1 Tax=Catharanthus roseus TaxID=4058 RepID=A0ACC0ARI7_CATRO|nr:hypothetical protein M9H77_22906 [Catharanthus roseus]